MQYVPANDNAERVKRRSTAKSIYVRQLEDRLARVSQKSTIDLERTHALPANSRFSVDTFTFSPSLMKRGTRISRPVSSRAALVPPPDASPRTAGSVWATTSSTNIGSSKPIGLPLNLRNSTNAPSKIGRAHV